MTVELLNATAVTVSWKPTPVFSLLIQHTSYCVSTGVIMSHNEIVLPPGVASTEVDIENGLTLDDMKENIQHKFTLQYIIVTSQGTPEYGAMTMQIFSFGMCCHLNKHAIYKQIAIMVIPQIRCIFRFSLDLLTIASIGE